MLGTLYVVKDGDTLWDISAKHLGDPMRWPEIHEHNNNINVVINTGTKIVDPNLIFVGQKIYIPGVKSLLKPAMPPIVKPTPNPGKERAKKKIYSVPFKYSFDDLPSIVIASPAYIVTVTLKGSVTIQAKDAVDFITFTKKGFEISAKKEADHALGKLVTETQVGYNPATKELSFEIGFTSHSNNPHALKTKAAAGISTKTGLPVIKGSIIAPDIKGTVNNHIYVTSGLNIEIEITPRPPTAKPTPHPVPVPVPVPVPTAKPVPSSPSTWDYIKGGLLITGAVILVVATVVEDVVTLGAGVADDPASFALASVMVTGAFVLFKTVNEGDPIQIEGNGVAPNQL